MRVAVVGAGAIGAYVGACLVRGGAEVTLVARGAHLAALQANGVRVIEREGEFVERPEATDDLAAIGDAELVVVGLKAYSVPALAPEIGDHLRPGAVTLWAQNGLPWWYFLDEGGPLAGSTLESVDPGAVTWQAIDHPSVVGCVVYCATEITEPGVIRHVEGNRFSIGEPGGEASERCEEIGKVFAAGGLKAPFDPRLRDQIWLKLLGNVAFNPVSAVTRSTLGELADSDTTVALLRAVFSEVAAVAEALGVRFPISLERRLQAGLAVRDHRSSMLQDLENDKPLEIDCMTGAVIELAKKLDIAVPRLETVHALVAQLDREHRTG